MSLVASFNRRHPSAFPYLLVLPAAALVVAVAIYPIFHAFRFSFYDSNLFIRNDFIGLENYRQMIDWSVLRNVVASLIFVCGSTALSVATGLVLAMVLNGRLHLRTTIRTIIFVPWVVSQIASALTWRWLVNPDYGPLVYGLEGAGLPRINFLGDANLAMLTLVLTNVWRSAAFSMIILLAALQGIPENILRSAQVDSASASRVFQSITLPLLMPSIVVCIILSSFSYFNIITIPLVLTGGGPFDATEILTLRMYKEAFTYFDVGFASALTMLILVLNVVLTLVYLKVPHEKI